MSDISNVALALSYLKVSFQSLRTQFQLWQKHLPNVSPYYAVKCNNDPVLMQWMKDLYPNIGFDCASEREIQEALPISGPKRIIYAQPCKKLEDIKLAQARGIPTTVADSVEEIEKLAEAKWAGDVLIRLLVRDSGSKQPFGKKFGAPIEWLPRMYDASKSHKLNLTGFSFHVGSECQDPMQYKYAIQDCKNAANIALQKFGYHTHTIDIGGGFIPDKHVFAAVAKQINHAQAHFPKAKFIAEPGRFFAAPTHTLYTTVIGKKPVWPPAASAADPQWRITLDESVYGTFSNIPFDGQKPVLENMRRPSNKQSAKKIPMTVFGRTCDSGDLIGTSIPLFDVQVGDVLRVRNMGAYTTVTASEFNGFPKPSKIYELK